MCKSMNRLASLVFAATLSATALSVEPASALEPVPTWTHQLPSITCVPLAPSTACLTTQPLDLRRVVYFRVTIQAMNYGLGVPEVPAVIRLRDANNLAAECFGQACPTITIPFGPPSHGACCMPSYRSILIPIPASQRRADVRLRFDVVSGGISFAGSGEPPSIQFYTN